MRAFSLAATAFVIPFIAHGNLSECIGLFVLACVVDYELDRLHEKLDKPEDGK